MSISSKAIACVIVAAHLLLVPLASSCASPVGVSLPSWDGQQSTNGWLFSDPASVKVMPAGTDPSYVSVNATSVLAGSQVGASIPLPLDDVRGTNVEVRVDIRAKNVTQPEHSYNGIKAMLHVVSPSRSDTWDQANANGSTFPVNYDWTTFAFRTSVPTDANSATLILGLQESTGLVDFRNLQVVVLRRIPVKPAHPPVGPLYTGHGVGALRGVMISPGIQPADIAVLQQWGVNLVRFQLLWNGFPFSEADTANVAEYNAWLDGMLSHVDEVLPAFKKAGILVVIDLHTPPGGRDHVDKAHRIFTDKLWQDEFGKVWEKIATRYRNEKQVWGYDLVNEPIVGLYKPGLLDWHDLAEQTARQIRAIDPNHAIIVEPDPGGGVSSLANFEPIDVPRVVYSVHMYDPGQFTHQGVLAHLDVGPVYPGVIDGVMWDKDRIRKDFQSVVDWSKAYNAAIYIGEFSAVRWANGADRYIGDVIDLMEENHWDWSYHAFREWQGWSPEVGEDKAVTTPSPTPTARLRVLQAAFAKNTPQSGVVLNAH